MTANIHRLAVEADGTTFRIIEAGPDGDQPATGEYDRDVTLPSSLRLGIRRLDDSGGDVEFYPNGRLTPAILRLSAEWGETVELQAGTPADSFHLQSNGGVR